MYWYKYIGLIYSVSPIGQVGKQQFHQKDLFWLSREAWHYQFINIRLLYHSTMRHPVLIWTIVIPTVCWDYFVQSEKTKIGHWLEATTKKLGILA